MWELGGPKAAVCSYRLRRPQRSSDLLGLPTGLCGGFERASGGVGLLINCLAAFTPHARPPDVVSHISAHSCVSCQP
jgi:hypothetical protein